MRKRNIPLYHQVVEGHLVPICLRFAAFDERALLDTLLKIKIKLSPIESDLTVSPYYL